MAKSRSFLHLATMVGRPASTAVPSKRRDALATIYPFFVAAAKQFRYGIAPFENVDESLGKSPQTRAQAAKWMDQVDKKIAVHELRKLVHSGDFIGQEITPALIARYIGKPEKTGADRDKLDYLLAHYLRRRSDAAMHQGELDVERAAQLLEPVLGKSPGDSPQWLEPLDIVINDLRRCASLSDLDGWEIIQRGRNIKVEGRDQYFSTGSLVAFARFNFLLAQSFGRLLQADLAAIELLLDELEARAITTVNCTTLSLGQAEPICALRDMCHNWKQPTYKDYTDLSFQRIVKLRQALEERLGSTTATPESRLRYLELRLQAVTTELEALRQHVNGNAEPKASTKSALLNQSSSIKPKV